MSQPTKKIKLSRSNPLTDHLNSIRSQIKNIQSGKTASKKPIISAKDETDDDELQLVYSEEEVMDFPKEPPSADRKYFKAAEARIHRRIDTLEGKLDTIMKTLEHIQNQQQGYDALEMETAAETAPFRSQDDEQFIEIFDMEKVEECEFPIVDEEHFEWFEMILADDNHRANLVEKRSHLVKGLSFKTMMVAVKQFLLQHFELEVCTKYSTSGYGSHGTKKKKVNAKLICTFVTECFLREDVETTTTDIMKCVVQFFGRAPDMYNKRQLRIMKQENRADFDETYTD